MTGSQQRPRWVYVAGHDRSGSTLVGMLLSRGVGGLFCGELHILWYALVNAWTCSCGELLSQCALWGPVSTDARAAVGIDTDEEAAAIMRMRLRRRHLLAPRLPPPRPRELALRRATERALERHSNTEVIVDTSKLSSVLWTAAHIDRPLSVVHLVRDPRAVVFSQGRPTSNPSRGGAPMRRRPTVPSSLDWLRAHLTTERVMRHDDLRTAVPATRLRYEDLVEDEGAIDRVVADLAIGWQRHAEAERGLRHVIGGNVVRRSGRTRPSCHSPPRTDRA